jgi:hypothetical protein
MVFPLGIDESLAEKCLGFADLLGFGHHSLELLGVVRIFSDSQGLKKGIYIKRSGTMI